MKLTFTLSQSHLTDWQPERLGWQRYVQRKYGKRPKIKAVIPPTTREFMKELARPWLQYGCNLHAPEPSANW